MKIIPGPPSQELSEKISQLTGYERVTVAHRIFPDGESYIRIEGNVQDEHVAIVHTTSAPQDTRLMQLAFIAAAAKRKQMLFRIIDGQVDKPMLICKLKCLCRFLKTDATGRTKFYFFISHIVCIKTYL